MGRSWRGKEAPECYTASIEDAAILHHESCNFDKWKDKYTNLVVPEEGREIPTGFKFYNQSIEMVQKGGAEAMLYYEQSKVFPYAKYANIPKRSDGLRIV